MNEKFKQLALKAKMGTADFDAGSCYVATPDRMQLFAESIVRECTNIGDNYQDILGNEPECFNCRKVAYGIVDKIKQHFGVEQ